MKSLSSFFVFFYLFHSYGQDTTYYSNYDDRTFLKEDAFIFEVKSAPTGEMLRYFLNGKIAMEGSRVEEVIQGEVTKYYPNAGVYEKAFYKNGSKQGLFKRWYRSGQLMGVFYGLSNEMQFGLDYHEEIIDFYFEDGRQTVMDGVGFCQTFYLNGKVSAEGEVLNGRKHNSWIGYNIKGQVIYRENYDGNTLIDGESYLAGSVYKYEKIDVSSEYSEGNEKFEKVFESISHPEGISPNRKKGTMFVFFIIEVDGSYSNVRFFYSLGPKFEEEIKRALGSLDTWIPGSHRGIKLRQKMVQTIVFD